MIQTAQVNSLFPLRVTWITPPLRLKQMADLKPAPDDFCNEQCLTSDSISKTLDELYNGDWKRGLSMLKKWKGADPLCHRLESIYPEIMALEPLETTLWQSYKLPGPLDPVTLRQHCEESVHFEGSDAESCGSQKLEWLQNLDRLHRLRKEKFDILTHVSEKYRSCVTTNEETLKRPEMWALLIGINEYQRIPPLQGTVRDTEMIKQYLVSDLAVPANHIRILTNADATRTAILSALYDLRDNTEIQRGDAILIHYSGHGASYDAHETFQNNDGSSIEAICPVDRGVEDATQEPVLDISDREINLFLSELSRVKGDNITLVLDCSFSADVTHSSASDPKSNVLLSRGTVPIVGSLRKMLLAAEKYPRKRWPSGSALTEDWTPDLSSHVVLAACQDFENAWECSGTGGDFTIALLKALRSLPLHTSTYRDLIRRIGSLRRQQPCAVGNYVDNFILNHSMGPQYNSIPRTPHKPADVRHQESLFMRLVHCVLVWLRY